MSAAEHLFCVAQSLFQKQGFGRTTVNQICQYAELSRVTFYKHYRNKEELIEAVLKSHIQASQDLFKEFETAPWSLQEKVQRLIAVKIQESRRFKQDLISELFNSPHPRIRQFIADQAMAQRHALSRMFAKGREEGSIRAELSDELLFYLLGQLERWFVDPAFHQLVPNFEDKIHHSLSIFFFGISQGRTP